MSQFAPWSTRPHSPGSNGRALRTEHIADRPVLTFDPLLMYHASQTTLSNIVVASAPAQIGGSMTAGQAVILALVIVALTIVMFSTRRRTRQSQALSRPTVRDRYNSMKDQQVAKKDLEEVMLELDQLSRQIHGRIDTKLARLEVLLREADKRIETLSRTTQPTDLPDGSGSRCNSGEQTGDARSIEGSNEETKVSVLRLAKSGRSSVEIAKAVGRTPGEVELMIALSDAQPQ